MVTQQRIVDNRVFILGLDEFYRGAMRQHESGELLRCADRVAEVLHAKPADVPVEGYYAEEKALTRYFRLVRALREFGKDATSLVDSLPEFHRLRDVMSAPLYGRPKDSSKLLPVGCDALSQALEDTFPEWSVAGLTAAACRIACKTDEISLVGLAARVQDSVVLNAVRESVVVYGQWAWVIGETFSPPPVEYVWNVDEDLAQHARRFIDTFNTLFGEELPPPDPAQAERYWHAYDSNEIVGRCVRLGCDYMVSPMRHYHWAICRAEEGFVVQEFWKPEVWTTTRYRSTLRSGGRCPEI